MSKICGVCGHHRSTHSFINREPEQRCSVPGCKPHQFKTHAQLREERWEAIQQRMIAQMKQEK